MSATERRPLAERLQVFGCPEPIRLDEPLARPEQIEYLDLLPKGRSRSASVTAVAEHQGTALLYVLDAVGEGGEETVDETRLAELSRQLANRSDPAWLALARPGSLAIYPIGFHGGSWISQAVVVPEASEQAPLLFQSLVHGDFSPGAEPQGMDFVYKKIYGLLTQTIDRFVDERSERRRLRPLDVLSMAGRALFFRFLIDRRIVLAGERMEICPAADDLKDAFANAEKAAQTSAWLDETFNGDFLRLVDESIPASDRQAREAAYLQFYEQVQRKAGKGFFDHLHAILNGWRSIGGNFQMELDWDDLDFAHIPVGVLSQVYESFSHRAEPQASSVKSVHYTPRGIARLMVDQAFAALPDPSRAQILDPACGAGIFLVLALRRLVAERWRAEGVRPDTRAIQSLLYGQLRGLDVSEPALRLAALALYITAIELNGTQRPPRALRFPKDLHGSVLFHVDETEADIGGSKTLSARKSFALGSLGPLAGPELDGTFDLVIGNPPWKRLREEEAQSVAKELGVKGRGRSESAVLNDEFTRIGRRALKARGQAELAQDYENPDKNPDLPFLWRATEWAKPVTGIIAMALPARVFGRTTGKGFEAWKALLRSVSITGLINGADLRKTAVWEGIDVPFCLFFARNTIPPEGNKFYYSTPHYEPALNGQGRFRIDYEAARPVSIERVERQPWVLKALSLGTWRDVGVVETLLQAFPRTLAEVWRDWNPDEDKTGKGFDHSPGLAQKPAAFLADLKVFSRPPSGFAIEFANLPTYFQVYGLRSAHMPRTEALYQAPLVIIPKAPGEDPLEPKGYPSSKALAFSQSYYGYSCAGHPEAEVLAAFLFLLVHSTLFRYFVAMTSVSEGADRMMFTKQDLDAIPFADVSELSSRVKEGLRKLALRVQASQEVPLSEIDDAVFKLYGLDDDAVTTVRDTLFSSALYRRQGRAALERATKGTREPFLHELSDLLAPYFDVCGERVRVEEPKAHSVSWDQPWAFLAISRDGEPMPVNASLIQAAMAEANGRSASRILIRVPGNRGVLLGLLNQRRWWTITRARLCAQTILREHLEALGLTEGA